MSKRRPTQPDMPQENEPFRPSEHLDREGQANLHALIREKGANMVENYASHVQRLRSIADRQTDPNKQKIANRKATAAEAVAPHVRDVQLTPGRVAGRYARQTIQAIHQEDELRDYGLESSPIWYMKHGADVADAVVGTGTSDAAASQAAGQLSPNNDPDNEVAALRGISRRLAGLDYSQTDVNKRGVPNNEVNAEAALKGNRVADSLTSPKVNAYERQIQLGMPKFEDGIPSDIPGVSPEERGGRQKTPDQLEHEMRAATVRDIVTGRTGRGQKPLDFYGRQNSREGMLDPNAVLPMDSWMVAAGAGQKNINVGEAKRTNVSKASAGDPKFFEQGGKADIAPGTPEVTPQNLVHGWHAERVIEAAAKVGDTVGLGEGYVTPAMVQPMAWSAFRRDGGKDPGYNAAKRAKAKDESDAAKEQKRRSAAEGNVTQLSMEF